MPCDAPDEKYKDERERLEELCGDTISETDYALIREFADAYDDNRPRFPTPPNENTKSYSTMRNYLLSTRLVAELLADYEMTLSEATADDLNRLFGEWNRGDHPDVREDGLAKSTLSLRQANVRKLLRYHREHGDGDVTADPEKVSTYDSDSKGVDPDDMYTADEIDALRDAAENPRDRCLLEMLIYTGQRIRVLQTLRVGDVHPEEGDSGVLYLNEDADGLKGASGKRPLLGARHHARTWLDYHPCSDDDDAAFFTSFPQFVPDKQVGEEMHQTNFLRILREMAADAGVDKPMNPHNFRHFAVTRMKRQYDMGNDTIKRLLGHEENSTIMESTYSHLSDEDHIKKAEEAAGFAEIEEGESDLTPETCDVCDYVLPSKAKACPSCGSPITLDAEGAKEGIEDTFYEGQREAEDQQESEAVDDLKQQIKDDPSLRAELIEELARQEGVES